MDWIIRTAYSHVLAFLYSWGKHYPQKVDDATLHLWEALDPWNHTKSKEKRLKAVQKAVAEGASIIIQDDRTNDDDKRINCEEPSNNTPLHIAVLRGYKEIFSFLIKKLKEGSGIESALKEVKNQSKKTVLDIMRDQKNKNMDILQGIDLDEKIIDEINQMLIASQQERERAAARNEMGAKYEDLVFCLMERNGRTKFQSNEFNIGREMKTRETDDQKFDDTVFSYKQDGKKYIIPIQVKHKGENKLINHQDLSKDKGEFSVAKYFLSYLDLRNDIGEIRNEENEKTKFFKDGEIQYVIIFTSANMDTKQLKEGNFILKDAPKDITDIFNFSAELRNRNYKQLEEVSDELKSKLLETFSEFEMKHKRQQNTTGNQKQEEIKNFLNRLVFIINQPKVEDLEWQLSDLNMQDILKGSIFKKILGDSVFQQYKKSLEEELSKKGSHLSGWINGEKAINYFHELANLVRTYITVAVMTDRDAGLYICPVRIVLL